jgi:hypothetical protein
VENEDAQARKPIRATTVLPEPSAVSLPLGAPLECAP